MSQLLSLVSKTTRTINFAPCQSNFGNSLLLKQGLQQYQNALYSTTRVLLNEEAVATKSSDSDGNGGDAGSGGGDGSGGDGRLSKKKQANLYAREYGRRRADYRRKVKSLRKSYLQEHVRYVEEQEKARQQEQAVAERKHLEKQRAKNIQSAKNALRQQELRRQAHLAFQDHLQRQQEKRDVENELLRQARQLVIDELEQEAPLWLTTPQEVEDAFTPDSIQLLWGRPQGVIGVPNPSLDSHFWSYECHTKQITKTYKSQRQILLEHILEQCYDEANIDPKFWSKERLSQRIALEEKAKLRALVRGEGRKLLLKRQQEYLVADDEYYSQADEPPRPTPVPSVRVLANTQAQEKEGARSLLDNPSKFFVFDNDNNNNNAEDTKDDDSDDSDYHTPGTTLGSPIKLKDPLRDDNHQGRVFPIVVGKLPKPDQRSEKERKRQEREERLLAAAHKASQSEEELLELAANDRTGFIGMEALNYDKIEKEGWDEDDEEWRKGLDPDSEAYNRHPEYRYSQEDIDWVIDQLQVRREQTEAHIDLKLRNLKQEFQTRATREAQQDQSIGLPFEDDSPGATTADGAEDDKPFLDDEAGDTLSLAGVDTERLEAVLSSLSGVQLVELLRISLKGPTSTSLQMNETSNNENENSQIGGDNDDVETGNASIETTAANLRQELEAIDGLTTEQIDILVEAEDLLSKLLQDEESQ